jgi:hypothetical protein
VSSIQPTNYSASEMDFSTRYVASSTIVASPALAAETIVATVTVANNVAIAAGVRLTGQAAFTVGTSGTAATMRIRKTNVTGTVVASTGALNVTAANLVAPTVFGWDVALVPGLVYVLTLQITAGAAASTLSGVFLEAFPV